MLKVLWSKRIQHLLDLSTIQRELVLYWSVTHEKILGGWYTKGFNFLEEFFLLLSNAAKMVMAWGFDLVH